METSLDPEGLDYIMEGMIPPILVLGMMSFCADLVWIELSLGPPELMDTWSVCAYKPQEVQMLLLDAAHRCPAVLEGDIMLVDEGHRAVNSRQGDVCLRQVH